MEFGGSAAIKFCQSHRNLSGSRPWASPGVPLASEFGHGKVVCRQSACSAELGPQAQPDFCHPKPCKVFVEGFQGKSYAFMNLPPKPYLRLPLVKGRTHQQIEKRDLPEPQSTKLTPCWFYARHVTTVFPAYWPYWPQKIHISAFSKLGTPTSVALHDSKFSVGIVLLFEALGPHGYKRQNVEMCRLLSKVRFDKIDSKLHCHGTRVGGDGFCANDVGSGAFSLRQQFGRHPFLLFPIQRRLQKKRSFARYSRLIKHLIIGNNRNFFHPLTHSWCAVRLDVLPLSLCRFRRGIVQAHYTNICSNRHASQKAGQKLQVMGL